MKIAYNPETADALTAVPSDNDIIFDLAGKVIYAKSVKFKGTDTTYSVFKKHTASDNTGGYNGLVPVPPYTTTTTRYLREDGTWVVPTNTTYSVFTGATSSTDGTLGLVPEPTSGNQEKFLKADGTWAIPTNTTYAATAGTADVAVKLQTTRKIWGQDFDGTANVSGNMTGVGNITIASSGNVDRFITFDTTATRSWRIGYLGTGNDDANYLAFQSTKTLTAADGWYDMLKIGCETGNAILTGQLTAAEFIGNLDGTYVNKLTNYVKATAIGSIAATDTLNTALGKLEYKADCAYDWIISVTAPDTDEYINKWGEIVDFLNKVDNSEGADITDEFVTRKTAQTIPGLKTFESDSETTGVSLILKNKKWKAGMSTAIDFYNGKLYKVPQSRIETKMLDDGRNGGTLIFYTQEKHAETNPNPNDLTERFRIGDNGVSKITGLLAVTGNITTSGSFCGNLNKTLTFNAGTFSAKTYDNSAATTVNIPTHTSHLTNNSGFLTQHQSLENYVTLNTALTITGAKTFDTTVLIRKLHTDKDTDKENYYGVRLLGSDDIGYLLLGQIEGDNKIHKGAITGINNTNLTSLEVKSLNTNFLGDLTITSGNTDKFINFSYNSLSAHSWRLGYLGTGDGDANYFVVLSGKADGTSWNNAIRLGNETLDAAFGGNVYPLFNNQTLGTATYRWSGLYSNTGNFSGNVTAVGFIKTNSSDSYVLLGGGSHKALSNFALLDNGNLNINLYNTLITSDTQYSIKVLNNNISSDKSWCVLLLHPDSITNTINDLPTGYAVDGEITLYRRVGACISNIKITSCAGYSSSWNQAVLEINSPSIYSKFRLITCTYDNTIYRAISFYASQNIELSQFRGFHKTNSNFGKIIITSGESENYNISGGGVTNILDYSNDGLKLKQILASDLKINGNSVIHTGNYTSYLDGRYYTESEIDTKLNSYLPLLGGLMDSNAYISWNNGADGNDVSDWKKITGNGLRIISSSTTTSNAPTQYSTALHIKGRYGFQLASLGGAGSNNFYIRNISNDNWNALIHSGNISAQSVNYASSAGNADTSNSTSKLKVHDVRDDARDPNYFDGSRVTAWFNNKGTPSTNWHSGIHVKGWTNSYTSWELCSYSSTGTNNDYDLYFRSGNNTTWGNWKTIITSGNIGSQSVNYAASAGSVAWANVTGKPTIPTVTNYYWANVKISSSSNAATNPTFATAAVTTSVTTPLITNTGVLKLNGASGVLLKYNDTNANSVVLNNAAFKPFDDANNKLTLGSSSARWSNVYSIKGNFTDDLTLYTASGDSPALVFQRGDIGIDSSVDWRIYVTSGHLKIQNALSSNNSGAWSDILHFDANSNKTLKSSYHVVPTTNDTLTLGTSSLKWSNVYATIFTGGKFVGNLNNTLTFSAGTFSANTYNNSAAITVNIPTHTSHLTNNSGFLTSRGYIGTTEVQASSATLALTGITTITNTGNITTSKSDTTNLRHTVSNSNGSVSLYTSTNRGMYDDTNSQWIVYMSLNGTHTYVPKWASKGGSTLPVYFNSSGEPIACTAYSGLLTDLSSTTTNAISITVGGTTKNITVATLKTSLGLGNVQNTAFYQRKVTVNGSAWNMAGTNSNDAFAIYAPTSAGTTGLVLVSKGSGAPVWGSLPGHSHAYLPLAGGTMNNTAIISRKGYSVSWYLGRDGAMIKTTEYNEYNPILSMKTTNGSWDLGVYTGDTAYLTYITDVDHDTPKNTCTYQLTFPKKTGTLAVTSDIPTSLPANGGNANTVDNYHIWAGSSSSLPASRNNNTIYLVY